jgi:hypothetical protein
MRNLYSFLAVVFFSLAACQKSQTKTEEAFNLTSPDKSIVLASSSQDLLARINTSVGLGEAVRIKNIEFPKSARGYYSIVTYEKVGGGESNIIYSPFAFATESSSTTIHTSGANRLQYAAPACYEYWCTNDGACTSCSVKVSDPFGSPSLNCSCTECHLHQKKYDCPQ